jgi:opacity protein-like surface antigen
MKTYKVLIFSTLITTFLIAQPNKQKYVELSFSGSYQDYSGEQSTGSTGALLFSSRLGFFVKEGFELEPEVLFMLSSGADPTYVLNGNVSYNFFSRRASTLFILIGYGIANTVPFFNVPFGRTNFSVGVVNIGAGIKAFLSDDIALRIEYRYQRYSGSHEESSYYGHSYTQTVDSRINSVQFGFSFLF